ncbi:capsule biosynthesis GfcC family protein [Enterobacter hormaechei]|uniref:capsule biosynthesis GfcC family protein n=1 Tax=Enterobacter hormaechei TaxID=158836 RepID=UPI001FE37BB3|nr:capsule biosynthesis GfcC family protein [Enterobacter hormaechei]
MVTVHQPGKTWSAEQADTLSRLVTQPQFNNVWWQGAAIATPSATRRAQQTQQQVLALLTAWQNRANDERAATVRAVAAQIRSLRIVGRQFVNLDPDAVRTDAHGDRPLEGRYDLWLSPAPRTVTLMGAVATPGKRAWRPGASIRDYLQGQPRLAGADRNNVTVIDPDGSTVVAQVGYWNARHIEAEPGAVLWVGFDPRAVPDDFTGLNEQIVALLTRRIPD